MKYVLRGLGTCAVSLLTLSGLLVGCSDAADEDQDTREVRPSNGSKDESSADAGAKPSAGGDAGSRADTALYALTTQVIGQEATDSNSYIVLTSRLDRELSLDDALEVSGRALGVGPEEGGAVFVTGGDAPTVTRYDLNDADELVKGESLSFQGKGVAHIGEYGGQFVFVDADKAYFFDGSTAQVVVWDPHDMRVTGDIALTDLVVEKSLLTFGAAPLKLDDQVLAFAGWREGPEVPSLAAVVMVDSAKDRAEVVVDDRCGYVRDGVLADDGWVYLATEAYGAAVHRLNDHNAQAPCLLRFDPEAGEFDADFHVDLTKLAKGAAVGSLFGGEDGSAFITVLDEDEFEITEETHPRVLASASAWRFAKLQLSDEPQLEELEAEPGPGSLIPFAFEGGVFLASFEGRDSTQFVELTSDGPSESIGHVPGLVFSAVKLR